MGLTAHNRKRREQEAQGQGGNVTRAQAHYDAADMKVAHLKANLVEAEAHLAAMAAELDAALPQPEKPKTTKKKTVKKGG